MSVIDEEQMYKDLDFTCPRCSTECTRTNFLEPTTYARSSMTGELDGPLCPKCIEELTGKCELVQQRPFETMFIVGVKPDGQGAVVITNGIEQPFEREATLTDIIAACNEVAEDLKSMRLMTRLTRALPMMMQSKQQMPQIDLSKLKRSK